MNIIDHQCTFWNTFEYHWAVLNNVEHYWNYQTKLLSSCGGESFEERKSLIKATPRVWTDGQLDVRAYSHQFPDQFQPAFLTWMFTFYKSGQIECQIETNRKNVTTPWDLYVSAKGTQICWHLNRINILFHLLNSHHYTCTVIVIILVGVTFWLSILTATRLYRVCGIHHM